VTSPPPQLVTALGTANSRLLAGLRKDPRSRSPLVGVDDNDVIRSFIGASAARVTSSDLTRASDLGYLDAYGSVAAAARLSGKFTAFECDALELAFGEQEVTWPNGHTATTNRGSLMGLPGTWAAL